MKPSKKRIQAAQKFQAKLKGTTRLQKPKGGKPKFKGK